MYCAKDKKMDIRSKQHVTIDFCVQLGKDINKTCALMSVACGEECFANRTIRNWHKSFQDGRTEMGELPWSGRLRSSLTEINIKTVTDAIGEDRHYSVRKLEDLLHIPKTTIHQILKNEL